MAEPTRSPEVERYLGYISAYDKAFKKWIDRTGKIIKRYRDDAKDYTYGNESARFNILWSNIQTLVPATFSRLPQPDVSRRFRDSDPVGRVASLILERALDFEVRHFPDYREVMKNSVMDRFLGGRGICWVRYAPVTSVQEPIEPDYDGGDDPAIVEGAGADQVSEDEPLEQIDDETAPLDYVNWRDFGHSVARTWEEVTCVWRRVYLPFDKLCERFGEEIARRIPLDAEPAQDTGGNASRMKSGGSTQNKQGCIYELWDKSTQKAVWLHKSLGELLDEKDDPLDLEGFWPCPKPLFGTTTSETLVPVPDFIQYQDQANELDTISDRIDGLIKALKVRGVYNAEFKELQRLFTEAGNNDLIAVKSFAAFAEKGGMSGAIDLVDLTPIANALSTAFEARANVVDQIYSITGISDIMRGDTDAAETAAAQGIKAQFGAIRLRNTQEDVAIYATDLLRLKSQVMCNKFTFATILQMCSASQFLPEDQQYVRPALQLLTGRVISDDEWQATIAELTRRPTKTLRAFRIEVDADSLVQIDEDAQKSDRIEFIQMVSKFLQQAVPAAQQTPEIAPVLVEMLKFGVSAFKAGKTLEGMIDNAAEQLTKQIQQQASQPKPPPIEIQKINAQTDGNIKEMQAKAKIEQGTEGQRHQMEQAKLSQQGQFDAFKAHLDQQTDIAAQRAQAWQEAQTQAMEAHRDQMKADIEARQEQARMMMESERADRDRMLKLILAKLSSETTLEAAQLSADTTLEAAQVSAARAAEPT